MARLPWSDTHKPNCVQFSKRHELEKEHCAPDVTSTPSPLGQEIMQLDTSCVPASMETAMTGAELSQRTIRPSSVTCVVFCRKSRGTGRGGVRFRATLESFFPLTAGVKTSTR